MEEYFKIYHNILGGASFSKGGRLEYFLFKSVVRIIYFLKGNRKQKKSDNKVDGLVLQVILSRNQFNISKALKISRNKIFFDRKYAMDNDSIFYSKLNLIQYIIDYPGIILQELSVLKNNLLKENWIRVVKLLWMKTILTEIIECSKSIKYIINYNDHSPYNVMIHQIGKRYNLTTIYIQHANVSKKFPPLYHDINLLFNQKSLDIYRSVGETSNKVELIGDIRLRNFENFTTSLQKRRVLICPNKLDDVKNVIGFSKRLKKCGYDPVIRPHPSDRRWKYIRTINISRNRSVKQDLEEVNFVITNESAIIIESIFVGILTYLYSFKNAKNAPIVFDNYGFIHDGLIKKKISCFEELIRLMNEKSDLVNHELIEAYTGPQKETETIKLLKGL